MGVNSVQCVKFCEVIQVHMIQFPADWELDTSIWWFVLHSMI